MGERRVETLVFEYVKQDLASYLGCCLKSPGLSEWKIKVCIMSNYCML